MKEIDPLEGKISDTKKMRENLVRELQEEKELRSKDIEEFMRDREDEEGKHQLEIMRIQEEVENERDRAEELEIKFQQKGLEVEDRETQISFLKNEIKDR